MFMYMCKYKYLCVPMITKVKDLLRPGSDLIITRLLLALHNVPGSCSQDFNPSFSD